MLVIAMLAAAMIPWWPVYESEAFVVAASVAILAGAAIGVLGARFRWPAWRTVVAMFGAYLVLGVPAAVPGRALGGVLPTPQGIVELLAGAALSWKQLVTIAVPVGSYQALLVPPFLLGLVASTVAITIALRSRHPSAAVVPPALLLLAGIALGVVHAAYGVETGLAFLVAAVAWLVRVGIARRRAITTARPVEAALADARRVLGASVLVAVALVGATTAAFALPVPHRSVVRAELQPPFEPEDHESPLAGFRSAFDPEVADRPMLAVDGLPTGWGIRIATLDTYDGIVYSVGGSDRTAESGRFTRVPYRLDQSAAYGERVEVEVSVLGYSDVWVPGIGRLERITFEGGRAELLADGFFYNDVTGTGAVQPGLENGDHFIASSVAPLGADDLSALKPGTSVLPAAPELPDKLARLLEQWAPASDEPGERLAAMIAGFKREGYVSHGLEDERPSRSGHALDRLVELVTERPMIGDGEQYAVAAALMARRIGFPARVVVGYLPDQTDPDDETAGGATVLVGGELQAWIEVQTADGRWLAIDPNPEPREIPEQEPDEPTVVSRPQSALPPPAERTPVDDLDADPELALDDRDGGTEPWLAVLLGVLTTAGFVILGLAVLVSPFLAIIAAKLRRRRLRRLAPTPVERIEGGWQEFADTAADYGYAIRPNATRAEQAATVGGLGPLVLAAVVDRAVFAPDGPSDGADRLVWDSVGELQQRLGAPRTRWERLRAAISLASLGG
ncbi:transglutaminase-like domain-containing protein [Agromyces bauzanensis]|uniref:Cysteine protease n=1 Tax=Agromyces bauzanensis TaxID=1308924 RepID=A0A917PC36_9MICO|nr:cysteine protease [Agromyces bauzanensis]